MPVVRRRGMKMDVKVSGEMFGLSMLEGLSSTRVRGPSAAAGNRGTGGDEPMKWDSIHMATWASRVVSESPGPLGGRSP